MGDAFKKWKTEHPTAYKRALLVLAGILVGAVVVGWFKFAHAETVPLQCPGGNFVWDNATRTLTCPSPTGGGPVDPPPVVTPPPANSCPANAIVITGVWGEAAIETAPHGAFGNNYLAVAVQVPASQPATSSKTTSWVEFQAGPAVRYMVFSTKPCDFSTANALKNGSGQAMVSTGQIRPSFVYKVGAPGLFNAGLTPGNTYWINIKNTNADGTPTCTIADCSMRGSLPK